MVRQSVRSTVMGRLRDENKSHRGEDEFVVANVLRQIIECELKDMGGANRVTRWSRGRRTERNLLLHVEPASTSEETYKLLELQRFEPDTSKDAPMGYDDDEDDDDGREKRSRF